MSAIRARVRQIRHAKSGSARVALAASLLLAVISTIGLVTASTQAITIQPFATRFTTNDNGAIALFGNNVMTCRATGTSATTCPNARAGIGSGAALNNNNYFMINLDQDGATFPTFNSSSATVTIPSGQSVLWAGLYWGARINNGSGSGAADAPASRNQMKFRGPGDAAYRTLVSEDTFGPTATSDQAYQQFRDVTSIVRSLGPGTYWGADVAAATGEDRYAGWSLVVVYRDPTLPLRNLTVFDGFTDVGQNDEQLITIAGFLAPLSGTVDTQLGMVAYEGDRGSGGDAAVLIQPQSGPDKETLLATDVSLGTNFFNSTNDRNGTIATDRAPADLNMFGFDIKQLGAPGAVDNGSTSFNVELSSNSERYYAGVVTTTINLYSPDFTSSAKTVVNLSGNDPAQPGDVLEYTLDYSNTGQDPASAVIATDPLPAGVTYEPGSLEILSGPNAGLKSDASDADQAEFLSASRTVRFRLGTGATGSTGGVLGVGASTSARFRATVNPVTSPTTTVNQASLAYRAQTINAPFTYVGNAVSTPIVPVADLSITKSTAPDPVSAGDRATSTITIRNTGPSPATGVVVVDQLPAGVTFVSATPSAGACSQAGGTVSCAMGTLPNGATATVRVIVTVPSGSVASGLTDQASVHATTPDQDPSGNTASSTVAVTVAADLSIVKTALTASAAPGEVVEFRIVITNNGPSDARNLTLTDAIAPLQLGGSTVPPGMSCQEQGAGFQCTADVLAAGATLSGIVRARIPVDFSGSSVSNTASVVSSTRDPNPGNDTDTATVSVEPPSADVSVVKDSDRTGYVTGDEVTFTVVVANEGPSLARSVTLRDALPGGLAPVAASTNRGTCTLGATVTCDLGDLEPGGGGLPGATATITIVARIGPTAGGSITNIATVDASTADPRPANDTASATINVTPIADVAVEKSAAPNPVVPGAPVTYTVTVTNHGPAVAKDVGISDTLPSAFTLTDVAPSVGTCDSTGPPMTCLFGDLAVGASAEVLITMAVPLTVPGTPVLNVVTVKTDSSDPVDANNHAVAATTSGPLADVSVTKVADPTSPVAGGQVAYTVNVANAGPSVASDVDLSDALPEGTTLVSAPGCTGGAPNLSCTLGDLAPGASADVVITVAVDPGLDPGTALRNTATATSPTTDPSDANNTATATGSVRAVADIFATKQSSAPSAGPSETVTFTVTVGNRGPSVARSLSLVDVFELDNASVVGTLPPPCQFVAGSVECFLAELAPDSQVVLTLDVRIPSSAVQGVYDNVAIVSSTTPDPTPDDHRASTTLTVTDPIADLVIEKTTPAAELVMETEFSYELSVRADVGADAQGVVVTDTLPTELVPTSATTSQGTCEVVGQTVSCQLGTLRGREGPDVIGSTPPVIIVVKGTVPLGTPGFVVNTASVMSTTAESDPFDNSSSVGTPLVRQADLSITKVPDATEVPAGSSVGFSLIVSNAGPSDALDINVFDSLPPGIVFDPAQSDPGCTLDDSFPGAVFASCPIASLPVGESRTIRISGVIEPGLAAGEIVNGSNVFSFTTTDPNFSNNQDEVPIAVVQSADLAISKTPSTETPVAGSDFTYTIVATNRGPSHAKDLVVTDDLPPTLAFVSVTGDQAATCTTADGQLSCPVGDLAAGSSVSLEVTFHLAADQPAQTITNTATVTSPTPDPDPATRIATATVETTIDSDLSITKTALTDPIIAGEPASYRLDIVNHGPSDAPDVTVIDPLPPGASFRSGAPSQGSCQSSVVEGGLEVGVCNLGLIPVGATATVEITIDTTTGIASPFVNRAVVGAAALDPANADNEGVANTSVVVPADLSIAKSGPSILDAGTVAVYELTWVNAGPGPASAVVVRDTLPVGLTPQLPPSCTAVGQIVTCEVGNVAVGGSGTIELPALVDPTLADGTNLTNSVHVSSDTLDRVLGDNDASVTGAVRRAVDVSVEIEATQPTTTPGGAAGYIVTVLNNGPIDATDTELVVDLPTELSAIQLAAFPGSLAQVIRVASLDLAAVDVAAIDPAGCVVSGSTVTCAIGDLAVGESVGLVIGGRVSLDAAPGSTLVATATVTVAEDDRNPANDTSDASIRIESVAPVPTPPPTTTSIGPIAVPIAAASFVLLLAIVGIGLAVGVSAWMFRKGRGR